MQTLSRSPHRSEGFSLIAVLFIIAIATAVVGTMMVVTKSEANFGYRSQQMAASRYAAEALLEKAYLRWQVAMHAASQGLASNADLTAAMNNIEPTAEENANLGTFNYGTLQFCALAANGAPLLSANDKPAPISQGSVTLYQYRFSVTASPSQMRGGALSAGVERIFTRRDDTLSMGIFLNHSAGFHPGNRLIVDPSCTVHTNGTLYAAAYKNVSTSSLQFLGGVSYVDGYKEAFPPGEVDSSYVPAPPLWADGKAYADENSPSITRSGQLKPSQSMNPVDFDPEETFSTKDDSHNNDGFRELIEIPESGPDVVESRRLYNQADLKILISQGEPVDGKPATPVVRMLDGNNAPLSASVAAEVLKSITNPSTKKLDQATIHDSREASDVSVTTVNLAKLGDAIFKTQPDFNGVLYIADTTKTKSTDPKRAIRLTEGARLPTSERSGGARGFTVASQNGVYIQGDYNTDTRTNSGTYDPNALPSNKSETGNTSTSTDASVAAAVMADAVTLLSNNWDDSRSSNYEPTDRPAKSTTINASVLAGVSLNETGSVSFVDGGAHNIIRLLEDWSSSRMTFHGALTELFPSKDFNSKWSVYPNYSPGARRVVYDQNFKMRKPPGEPPVSTYNRGAWRSL